MRLAAKRLASLTCAAALMLSLAACSTSSASSAESTDDAPSMSAPGEGTPPDGQPPEKPDGAPDGQGGPGGGFGGSTFTGTLNIVENAAGGTAVEDNAVVTLEKGSTWTLTGDCTLTSLTNNGTIHFNGHTITLADGTVLS